MPDRPVRQVLLPASRPLLVLRQPAQRVSRQQAPKVLAESREVAQALCLWGPRAARPVKRPPPRAEQPEVTAPAHHRRELPRERPERRAGRFALVRSACQSSQLSELRA